MLNFQKNFIPIIGIVLIFSGLAFYTKEKKQEPVNTVKIPMISPAPISTPVANIKDEDGIYANYDAGFQIEYPKNMFTSNPTQSFRRHPVKRFFVLDDNGNQRYWMVVSSGDTTGSKADFDQLMNLPINASLYSQSEYKQKHQDLWPLWNWMKIRELKITGGEGFVVYSFPTGGGAGTPSWGYSAMWRVNGRIFTVGIHTSDEQAKLSEIIPTFDKIVKSFKLIDSSN